LGAGRIAVLRTGRALGLAAARDLEGGAAPFERRAALAGFGVLADFFAAVALAFVLGLALDLTCAFGLALDFGCVLGLAFNLGWDLD
jgi:hypothetical protein